MDKKKMQLIVGIIIVVIVIALVVIFMNKQEKKENYKSKDVEKTGIVDISEVFEIDSIENSAYEIRKSEENKIASKYVIGKITYELKSNVEFRETTGKMIYVRENYNKLNIYQTEYKLDKYENINSQVEQIIEEFDNMCREYLRLDPDAKAKSEELYGEASQKEEIPLSESIYNDNRLYSKTYEIKAENEVPQFDMPEDKTNTKTYDVNFYRNGEKIICEFVYVKGD